MEKKISHFYENDRFINNQIDEIVTNVLQESRNYTTKNRLLQLVQLGNHTLFEDEI
jgi:hypothetical protein